MKARIGLAAFFALGIGWASLASGAGETRITYLQALARARQASPSLAAVRSREGVVASEIGIAGTIPNPTVYAGTATQTARLSVGVSIPLQVFGQRRAGMAASRADLDTARLESQMAEVDIRSATAHAYVVLWLAERTAEARLEASNVGHHIELAVLAKVELGAAPEVEGFRARAEQLRLDANAQEALRLVDAAAVDFGRWLGMIDASDLRTSGDPPSPGRLPPLQALLAGVRSSPAVRRDEADARAAGLRAKREQALVRPAMTLDLGADAWDPALPQTNYRVQLGVEVPLFSQRGPFIEREERAALTARLQAESERVHRSADLTVAYRTFQAVSARRDALETGVLPATEAAARATRESYQLGRASLEAVLDAERARIDTQLAFLEAAAARAQTYIDIQRALGQW